MKKIYLMLFTLIIFGNSYGQKNATTEDGQQIVVYDNGTWKPKKQNIKLKFVSKKNSNREVRLYLVVNSQYYDINHWFEYKSDDYINYGIQTIGINNEYSKEKSKIDQKYNGPDAYYTRGGGITVNFLTIIENGFINVYREVINSFNDDYSYDLVKTITIY